MCLGVDSEVLIRHVRLKVVKSVGTKVNLKKSKNSGLPAKRGFVVSLSETKPIKKIKYTFPPLYYVPF